MKRSLKTLILKMLSSMNSAVDIYFGFFLSGNFQIFLQDFHFGEIIELSGESFCTELNKYNAQLKLGFLIS